MIVFLVLVGLVFGAALILLLLSPGTPRPVVDAGGARVPGSISERAYVDINGWREGMIVRSRDPRNPVLLYLHGGIPDYFLDRTFPTRLDDLFTVVWWEQRGSGMSYRPDLPSETLTVEQQVADTLEVTNYLRKRFSQDKIFLMGHSGGTFIGIQAAARAPQLYRAWIGVAQMANQLESEKLAWRYMREQYAAQGDEAMVRRLDAARVTDEGTPAAYLALRDEGMHRLGVGTMRNMRSVVSGVFVASWLSPEYTVSEKLNLWRAKAKAGVSFAWQSMTTTDLAKTVPALEIPVYFFHGRHDLTCAYDVAKSYFEKLEAPTKGFYTFEQSAHSPVFEEPERSLKILKEDVLAGKTELADE